MGRRGRNRDRRDEVLALIEQADAQLHAELVELRSTNPQAYRKRIRYWVQYYPIAKPQKVMANRGAKFGGQIIDHDRILDVPFQWMRHALKAGTYDDRLDELVAEERAGRDRPLIYQLIDDRRREMEATDRPPELPRVATGWEQRPVVAVGPEPEEDEPPRR